MTNPRGRHSPALPTDYSDLLAQIKDQVRAARLSAARAVNVELIALYWRIGRIIQQRQNAEAGARGSSTGSPRTCGPSSPGCVGCPNAT